MTDRALALVTLLGLCVIAGCQAQQGTGSVACSRFTEDYWQIWTIEPDGSNAKQITVSASDKRYPVWTQEGQGVFFRTNNNRVFCLDLATGQETLIIGRLGLNGGVVPSLDGSQLLMSRFSTQLRDSSDLWLADMDGNNARILTSDAGLQHEPAWSPDGKHIAYISSKGFRADELYIMDTDGKNRRRLTKNKALESLPAFSPDGKSIAYSSDITGDYEIWVIDFDGSNPRQLTNSYGIDTRPCWSPDGSRIMFVSNRTGELQLWIMNSDGSEQNQVTSGLPTMDSAWRGR